MSTEPSNIIEFPALPDKGHVLFRACPFCHNIKTQREITQSRFDNLCGTCGQKKHSEFIPAPPPWDGL